MRRLVSFCQIASLFVLPVVANGQAMVSYGAAAAAGSSAGAVAGSKLGKALDGALGNAAGATERAAKQEPATNKKNGTKPKVKPPEMIHVTVAPEEPMGGVIPVPSATIRPKQAAAVAQIPPVPELQPVAPPPLPTVATTEALATISSGAKREDLGKLGSPASRMSIPEDGHLIEVYRYQADGKDIGTVRLTDGVVTTVQVSR